MKVCHALVALASLSLMASASATSLKLSPDVDVLVIDGKLMSGAILKGAESLELDGGQHQILFQVSKYSYCQPAAASALSLSGLYCDLQRT